MTIKDENYYRRQIRRRNRILIIGGVAILLILTSVFVGRNIFFDFCTNSFDRQPESVIRAYISAIENGNSNIAQRCWDRNAYYEIASGCSEACLSRLYGTDYSIDGILIKDIGPIENRDRLHATIHISCPRSGEIYQSEIVLDSITQDFSWKHWKILESDLVGRFPLRGVNPNKL